MLQVVVIRQIHRLIVVFIGNIVLQNETYKFMLIIFLAILGLIFLVQTLHKVHKTKEKLKSLEERIEKI